MAAHAKVTSTNTATATTAAAAFIEFDERLQVAFSGQSAIGK